MHATLLDLPDPLADVYRTGRCTDVTALYDLTRLYKANKEEVITWLALSTQEEISRLDVYQFSKFLKLKKTPRLILRMIKYPMLKANRIPLQLITTIKNKPRRIHCWTLFTI
jgi:hypothetical protein